VKLTLKVVHGASCNSVEWLDAEKSILKVRMTAAPEKGKANKAVIRLLAKKLGLPASAISLVSGNTSKQKLVEIDGITEAALRTKFP
jgi:uncharacterized protein (TIGR00251 family)